MAVLRRFRGGLDAGVLRRKSAEDLAAELLEGWTHERRRLDKIDKYLHGEHDAPYTPTDAKEEYRLLARRAIVNMCPLIVTETVQQLRVDGYRRGDDPDNATPWRYWQANGLDSRQIALHHAALAYGLAYEVVLPGTGRLTGEPIPHIRGLSPREMYAAYADPAWDDWPIAALRVEISRGSKALTLYDEVAVYQLTVDAVGDKPELTGWDRHDLGVCPVVKFSDMPDLEGRVTGQVEPYIVDQDRINQDVFDRLLTQTYSSFKVRYATGIAIEKDENGNPIKPLELGRNRLLTSSSKDAEFGSLDESPLDGFLRAEEQDVRRLASKSQTPPTSLLGEMANLSAESLVAARIGADNKGDDRKMVYGERHEQKLRLSGHAAGDPNAAVDYEAQVQWRDQGARALGAIADAYSKMADPDGLGLPKQILWEKLPFLTQTDVERAKKMAAEADHLRQLLDRIGADLEEGSVGGD